MKKTVLMFDWDDTLMDIGINLCYSQHDACKTILAKKEKYPFTASWQTPSIATLQTHIGQRFEETILKALFPELKTDLHSEWIKEVVAIFRHNYNQQPKQVFPGVEKMLSLLKAQGYIITIATNKSRQLLIDDINAANIPHSIFDEMVCGDDDAIDQQFKPHPRMINIIQDLFKDADNFVMIGDRKSDIVAARESDKSTITKTIAITTEDFNADYTIESASKITAEIIQQLINN